MPLPNVNPLVLDELLVMISGAFMEGFSPDEQAVIGTFLATLGSVISFNSVYLLYTQRLTQAASQGDQDSSEDEDKKDEEWELIKKSIDKIQEKLNMTNEDKQ